MNHKFKPPKLTIGNRKSQISPLINPFTHQPILFFMQNEPNFILKGPTKHKNDANFNPNIYAKIKNFPKKSKKIQKISSKIPVSHHFFNSFPFFFYYFYTLFHLFYPPKAAFCRFFHLSNINTLNSMYNKDLHNFFTPARRYSSTHLLIYSFTLLCKTNPISPSSSLRPKTTGHRPRVTNKYAKQTQFQTHRPYAPKNN